MTKAAIPKKCFIAYENPAGGGNVDIKEELKYCGWKPLSEKFVFCFTFLYQLIYMYVSLTDNVDEINVISNNIID